MTIDVMKLYREFPAGGNGERGDWLKRCLEHIAAEAIKSALPEARRIMDEGEVKALAKKLRLPKYWWDTEDGRMHLARFAHEAFPSPLARSTELPPASYGPNAQDNSGSITDKPKGLPPYPLAHLPGCEWPVCNCNGRWNCKVREPQGERSK